MARTKRNNATTATKPAVYQTPLKEKIHDPEAFEIYLPPDAKFTQTIWKRKIKDVGGEIASARGVYRDEERPVRIPNTPEGCRLISALWKNYLDTTNEVIIKGLDMGGNVGKASIVGVAGNDPYPVETFFQVLATQLEAAVAEGRLLRAGAAAPAVTNADAEIAAKKRADEDAAVLIAKYKATQATEARKALQMVLHQSSDVFGLSEEEVAAQATGDLLKQLDEVLATAPTNGSHAKP